MTKISNARLAWLAQVKLDPEVASALSELQSLRQLDKEQESGQIQPSVSQSSPQPAGVRVAGAAPKRSNQEIADDLFVSSRAASASIQTCKLMEEASHAIEVMITRLSAFETQEEDRDPNQCYCQECTLPIRDDLLVPDAVWEVIKPEGSAEGAGLLCPTCIMNRAGSLAGWTVGFVYPERHGPGVVAGKAETPEEEAVAPSADFIAVHSAAGLPPAYGGCTCSCHRVPGVIHMTACCHPGKDRLNLDITKEWFERQSSLEEGVDVSVGVHPTPAQKEEEGQTVSEEMVEKAARALAALAVNIPESDLLAIWVNGQWKNFRKQARAALTAALVKP